MRRLAILLALPLLAGSCSTVRVATDWDPSVDFGAIQSYAWLDRESQAEPGAEAPVIDTLLARRVRDAVDPILAARGWRLVEADAADARLTFHVSIDERVRTATTAYGVSHYGPYGWGSWGWMGPTVYDTTVYRTQEQVLVVDVLAPDGRTLWWRGIGKRSLPQGGTPSERAERIRETVAAILADFPPES